MRGMKSKQENPMEKKKAIENKKAGGIPKGRVLIQKRRMETEKETEDL